MHIQASKRQRKNEGIKEDDDDYKEEEGGKKKEEEDAVKP